MSLRPLFVLAPFILALSACQQAAWKAGASADDLKRDDQTCRAQTPDDDAMIKQCLRGKGWTVAEFTGPTEDEAATSTANTAPAATQPVAPPLHPAVRNPSTAMSTETTNNLPGTEANTEKATSTGAATTKRAPDPLQRQSVQSWWKAGAQAADFNVDANTCLEQLGTEHAPDYVQHLYTRAMVTCLRARGWFAGRDPVYTPLR